LYGVVDYDEELQRKEAAGKVWIPGCLVEYDNEGRKLDRHCNACDQDFHATWHATD
jgi:hypothetical protein